MYIYIYTVASNAIAFLSPEIPNPKRRSTRGRATVSSVQLVVMELARPFVTEPSTVQCHEQDFRFDNRQS